ALEDLGRRLTDLAGRRQQVVADLEQAHRLLSEIGVAHRDAEMAHARWASEIQLDPDDAPPPAPADPARIEGVAAWLATLDATMGAGRWEAAGVGVDRWLAAARPLLHDDQEAARAAAAPLELRDELRGRLDARRQQARTLASRGQALDPGLASAAEEAETLLRRCPTPITRAARAVAEYEQRLARSRT
ncbi:MAG TPA: hypothetical protein VGI06_10455, partial [Acidimicrobiales bacterium]